MEWLNVIILGIIEGITEFLPISSTGHLVVAIEYFKLRDSLSGIFEIFIQLGAVLAVVAYYRVEFWQQAHHLINFDGNNEEADKTRHLWLSVLAAFLPSAILGLLFVDSINSILFNPRVVAIALIVGGVMFIAVENFLHIPESENQSIEDKPVTSQQAILIGLWQVLALIPGMSRSGMSILGGIIAGVDRERATQFSFYLALPTLGAATIYTLLINFSKISVSGLGLLLLGTVVSGIVAWISIGWLLRYVAHNSFVPFGYYRIIIGILILLQQTIF